jgi:hypothetical protein
MFIRQYLGEQNEQSVTNNHKKKGRQIELISLPYNLSTSSSFFLSNNSPAE